MAAQSLGVTIDLGDLARLAKTNVGKRGTYAADLGIALTKSGVKNVNHFTTANSQGILNWTQKGTPVIATVRSGGVTGTHSIVVDGIWKKPSLGSGWFVAVRVPGDKRVSYFLSLEDFESVFTGECITTCKFPLDAPHIKLTK